MYKYPKTISTIIESELISCETEITNLESAIEKIYNNKLYVIQWICFRIRSCLVFDLEHNLIDHYDNGAIATDKMYKNKSYYEWVGVNLFEDCE